MDACKGQTQRPPSRAAALNLETPESAILAPIPIAIAVCWLDQAKQPVHVVRRACRKEKLVLVAVDRRSGPAAEINSPKLVNDNRLSGSVLDGAHELPVFRAETIDRPH